MCLSYCCCFAERNCCLHTTSTYWQDASCTLVPFSLIRLTYAKLAAIAPFFSLALALTFVYSCGHVWGAGGGCAVGEWGRAGGRHAVNSSPGKRPHECFMEPVRGRGGRGEGWAAPESAPGSRWGEGWGYSYEAPKCSCQSTICPATQSIRATWIGRQVCGQDLASLCTTRRSVGRCGVQVMSTT